MGPTPILDIMMSPGQRFHGLDTQGGLRTGLRIYERLRSVAPDLPIVVFTNVTDRSVAQSFSRDARVWFYRKPDFLPHQFAAAVSHILSEVRRTTAGPKQ